MTEVLYTPWRMAYLTGGSSEPAGCLFCALPGRGDEEALIVSRGKLAYTVLNRFPYSNGHMMVAPFAHRATLAGMLPEERAEIVETAALLERALSAEYAPHGFNVGFNLGKCAGAGVPGHAHLHVVPRWEGDTNFMTVVAGTRTVPEELATTWRRITARLGALEGTR